MAGQSGFSLIEMLIVMAISALMVIGGSQLFGSTSERSRSLYYQSELLNHMEALRRTYRNIRDIPEYIDDFSGYRLALRSCGVDCRVLRLTPKAHHPCVYWELQTDGLLGAGRASCWPESAVRTLSSDPSTT